LIGATAQMHHADMVTKNFGERVAEAQKRLGLSVAEIARRAEVRYDNVRDLIRRPGSTTSIESAMKIAAVLGIELEDGKDASPLERVQNHEPTPDNGSKLVPVYDVAASAGDGAMVDYEGIAYSLAFPPDYLKRITSSNPDHLTIISVKGDSMEPTLSDDDIVMLDMSKTSLGYEGLFVIRIYDVLHVKRLSHSRPGHVLVISDNKDMYPQREYSTDNVEVVGKVLWAGGKV